MNNLTREELAVAPAAIQRARVQHALDSRLVVEELREGLGAEIIYEEEETEERKLHELDKAPSKLEDVAPEVQDPLEEVNLGTPEEPRITYVSSFLSSHLKDQLVSLLRTDSFAWNYDEMPGRHRELVEHRLPRVKTVPATRPKDV